MQLFVRVLDLGSFTRAAHELGLRQPAVSKQITALETHLTTQLLDRTSRGLRPTAAGLDLYQSAVKLLADLEETEGRVRGSGHGPAGLVRVATPPALGRRYIIPKLPAFLAQYPGVTVEFSVAERVVDFVKDGIDVALRVGALKSSTLVVRRIGSLRTITVAAPKYLTDHGAPADLDALAGHRLIVGQTDGAALPWQFQTSDGPVSINPSGPIRSNDGEDLRAAALAGLGILHGPSALLKADLQAGRLVRVLQHLSPEPVPIHAVHSSGHNTPQRVRVFMDFLAATFTGEPSLRL